MGALPFDIVVITDAIACQRAGRTVLETVQRMLADVAWPRVAVLLRDKQSTVTEVERLLKQLCPIVSQANASLLIHSYPQLALEYGLQGVHIAADVALAPIRTILGTQFLLGTSRHGNDSLGNEEIGLADYATISPIFSPISKPGDSRLTLGLSGLRDCVGRSIKPLVALGGIQPQQVEAVMAEGAAAIAVSGAILQAEYPDQVLKAFYSALSRSSNGMM